MDSFQGKFIIFSAPSGAGKTTLVRHVVSRFPKLTFSISATTRPPRGEEQHGVDYFFLTIEEFQKKIQNDEFVEYEEVYPGRLYGTLKSEIDKHFKASKHVIFDVDVEGGIRLKKIFGKQALAIFIEPPSIQTLEERLLKRGTDDLASIAERVHKANYELTRKVHFDEVLTNDLIDESKNNMERIVKNFLNR
ncbi:MAG: guanylate kinase [Flavobacteriales bacterium]|nr:MAG: guanylate kinase [Flavobacteriales bacterium]